MYIVICHLSLVALPSFGFGQIELNATFKRELLLCCASFRFIEYNFFFGKNSETEPFARSFSMLVGLCSRFRVLLNRVNYHFHEVCVNKCKSSFERCV
jgi:hypothetical protein